MKRRGDGGSGPGYGPNKRGQSDGEQKRDRAVRDIIEPGSAIKPCVIAKALDTDKTNLNKRLN
ncbi:hypothetical protein CWI61_10970, partial [Neisseria meningitidis]